MRSRRTGRLRRVAVGLTAASAVVTTSCASGEQLAEPVASGSPPAATSTSEAGSGTYLALGDSVPFGTRGGATDEFQDEDSFVGYPDLVGKELGLEVVNASCPGETTASFLDTSAQSNGCTNSWQSDSEYRTAYPLHVQYESVDQSQLDFAVDTLTETEDVELVTLQIGANDAFLCQRTTASGCLDAADLGALTQQVQTNLDRILSTLRRDGGYDGQLIVVTYYALNYADAVGAATRELDDAITRAAEANGADVADGYGAIEEEVDRTGGDSIAAGLVLPDDVHPTAEGQRLLAEAVTSVVDG